MPVRPPRPRPLREAKEPHFKFDESGALVPDIRAEAAIIYNPRTGPGAVGAELAGRTVHRQHHQGDDGGGRAGEPGRSRHAEVVIQRADVYRASTTYIRAGDRVTKDDLLHLLLIGSDNAAARVLARTSSLGAEGFMQRMNEKAAELGLESTTYVDPAGIFNANVSSAYDMARLISFASGNERMAGDHAHAVVQRSTPAAGRSRVSSTNQLVKTGDVDVQAGKTGFIRQAGYCLATLLRLPQGGGEVAVVVLGRQVERRPVLGNAPPVQLALDQGRGSARQPARSGGSAAPLAQ